LEEEEEEEEEAEEEDEEEEEEPRGLVSIYQTPTFLSCRSAGWVQREGIAERPKVS
jgi:hypothetical protein